MAGEPSARRSNVAETISKRERVQAALAGREVDRVPIAFWGHFAADPRTADEIVRETLAFQRRFDWDFVKLMPSGMYFPQALGCEITPADGPGGVNALATSVVDGPGDWARLPRLDPTRGWLAEHVESTRRVRAELGPDVPIIQTLFSPLTIAHKLSLGDTFGTYVRRHRDELEEGLARIAASSIAFAEATLEAGADGFFYATQEATLDELTEPEFADLGKRYDQQVLTAMGDRAWFNLLHVCRESIMADMVADYPVAAINWDSHHNFPSLEQAPRLWPQTLVGGLDRHGVLLNGTPEEVEAAARAAIESVGGRHLILSAGCALPLARPDENLDAARRAVGAGGGSG
jgi:uroporphyrinogen decarboxylase